MHERMKQQSPYRGLRWQVLGPTMCGGRIEAIACPVGSDRPQDRSTVYVGAGSGGVWKSINNGTTWTPVFDQQPTQAIGDIAVSPTNPDLVWVGTGEVLMARSSLAGLGVFKSEDGGNSWQPMGLEDTHHISRVVIDPTDPDRVFVAAIGHRYSGNRNRGIFRTIDGGKTWKHSLFRGDNISAIDLVMDPRNPQVLFAAMWERDVDGQNHFGSESGIYRTTDGGDTWTRLGKGLPDGKTGSSGRIAVSIAPTNSKVVYALFDQARFDLNDEREKPADVLFRSGDAGDSWQIVNDRDLKAGWDWCEIRVSPDDENRIYSIGQKSYVSSDGGKSFAEIGGTIIHLQPHGSRMLHLDTHAIWIDPENPNRVLFGNDGGLYLSWDRCRSWIHVNNLPIAECYAITHDRAKPFRIYAGTQDNAALYGPSTHRVRDGFPDAWRHVYLDPWGGGDSYFTFRDPVDENSIYYEHQFGVLRRKDMKTGRTVSIRPPAPTGIRLRNAWMTPYFPSRFDGNRLYYAANRVFRSPDRGIHWEMISPDLAAGPDTLNLRYKAITSLVESYHAPGILFAGTDNGNLFRTLDDGRTWEAIDQRLPRCNVRRIAVSPHDDKRIFVAMSGLQSDDFSAYVFRSDDQGRSWRSIAKGLPDARFNVVSEDPRQPDVLYAGSDLGVYVSLDGGLKWNSLSQGLPAVSVHDLFVHPDTGELVIGTHGRGVFLLNVATVLKSNNGD